jgi:hypothetical protein
MSKTIGRISPKYNLLAMVIASISVGEGSQGEGVYWAAPFEAIAGGMERCHRFNTPNIEEQMRRMVKKYGNGLKGAKIVTRPDGSRVFVANRHDPATGEDIRYAYFDSEAGCNVYQDQLFKSQSNNTPPSEVTPQKTESEIKKYNSYLFPGKNGDCVGSDDAFNQWHVQALSDKKTKIIAPAVKSKSGGFILDLDVNGDADGGGVTIFELKSDCEEFRNLLTQDRESGLSNNVKKTITFQSVKALDKEMTIGIDMSAHYKVSGYIVRQLGRYGICSDNPTGNYGYCPSHGEDVNIDSNGLSSDKMAALYDLVNSLACLSFIIDKRDARDIYVTDIHPGTCE